MQNSVERFHALDSLRAIMMLLGVYLHVAVGYSYIGDWSYKDYHPTHLFETSIVFIHIFRMPAFYLMAGFFGALLYYRRGVKGYLANRARRVLLPLLASWAVFYLTLWPLGIYCYYRNKPDAVSRTLRFWLSTDSFGHLSTWHLWFLYYLVFLYALALGLVWVVRRLPGKVTQPAERWFRAIAGSVWGPAVLAVPTVLSILGMRGADLETHTEFVPSLKMVLAYLPFFGTGWMLYRNSDLLAALRRHAWIQTGLGLTLTAFDLGCFVWWRHYYAPRRAPVELHHLAAIANALAVWFLVCGLTGLFVRYLDRNLPRMRYLADSSYWMYLVHPFPVTFLQLALEKVALPVEWKAVITLLGSVPILLGSYHLMVRSTFIGQFLNGRRPGRAGFQPAAGLSARPAPVSATQAS